MEMLAEKNSIVSSSSSESYYEEPRGDFSIDSILSQKILNAERKRYLEEEECDTVRHEISEESTKRRCPNLLANKEITNDHYKQLSPIDIYPEENKSCSCSTYHSFSKNPGRGYLFPNFTNNQLSRPCYYGDKYFNGNKRHSQSYHGHDGK